MDSSVFHDKQNETRRVTIGYDNDPQNPREYADLDAVRFHFRDHRYYYLPKEIAYLDLDDEDQLAELQATNHVFALDAYEHGSIRFSFAGTGPQCRFDTSPEVGIIAVSRAVFPDVIEARASASQYLSEFNSYLNGEVYEASVYEAVPLFDSEGVRRSTEWEHLESFVGHYDINGLSEAVRESYPECADLLPSN